MAPPSTYGGTDHGHAVGHHPSLIDLNERAQIFRAQQRYQEISALERRLQTAGSSIGDRRYQRRSFGDVAQFNSARNQDAFCDHLLGRVKNEQFRNRRLVVRAQVGQEVRNVNPPAIARKQHLLGISMRAEALDFGAGGKIDQRDTVGNAVGHVKSFARAVGDETYRSPAGFQGALHQKRCRIDFTDRVTPFVRNVKGLAVRRNGKAAWFVAHLGSSHHSPGFGVNGQNGIGILANHVELLPVRGKF